MMFTGSSAGGPVLKLLTGTYRNTEVDPADATAYFVLYNTGSAEGGYTSGTAFNWLEGGTAGNYEVYLTTVSGTLSTGPAVDTWHSLGTTRSWSVARLTTGTKTFVGNFKIRRASDLAEMVANTQITIEAVVEVSG